MAKRNKTTFVLDDMEADKSEAQRLAELDYARQAAHIQAGKQEETYGIWGPIWRMLVALDASKGKHRFNKKTYLWLMLFLGWLGGHRYYQGRWKLGLLYTLFCWTGIPGVMALIDWMIAVPKQPDENGMILI